jgi:hypothetical protein
MTWLTHFLAWLQYLLIRWFSRPYRTIIVQESLPSKLHKKALYIVEEDGFQEQAAMFCPCGRNHILHMNLLPDERPCWKVTLHEDGTATLQPSVWRKKDCSVHFWFRSGRVYRVKDELVPR